MATFSVSRCSHGVLARLQFGLTVALSSWLTIHFAMAEEPKFERRPIAAVSLNTVGYLPKSQKIASIRGLNGEFVVRSAASSHEVVRGSLARVSDNSTPLRDAIYFADFSAVSEPGTYALKVAGEDNRIECRVADDLFNWPFYCSVRAMYLWRCGCEVQGEFAGDTFRHAACHLDDGYLDYVDDSPSHQNVRRDARGGWHDAGDYNKYTVNGAFTAGMMLMAWEHFGDRLKTLKFDIPESSNAMPDYLDEVRWEIEWLLKMQADDGSAYHKLSTLQFGGFIAPDKETEKRYFSPWGSAATADLAAVAAQAARVYRPYDPEFAERCVVAAQKSYAFLEAHPEYQAANLRAFGTGAYETRDRDERLWAAAELWETTGDDLYLQDLTERITAAARRRPDEPIVDSNWDWSEVRNLGLLTFALSQRMGGEELREKVRKDVVRAADEIATTAGEHPYGRPLGAKYYWGCNGTVVRLAMNLHAAEVITGDAKYRAAMLDGINFVFGRNVHGCSYVTGLGRNPPLFPHDRRSAGDNVRGPWPGYLVGGPWPAAEDWHDAEGDYRTNEIAINWNGALIYALAAFVEPQTFPESINRYHNKPNEKNSAANL